MKEYIFAVVGGAIFVFFAYRCFCSKGCCSCETVAQEKFASSSGEKKKVGLVLACRGYQVKEFQDTKAELEKAGFPVVVISNGKGKAVGHDGSSFVKVDMHVDEVVYEEFGGIFIIGGPGAMENLNTPNVHELARQLKDKGIPHGAICISPRILAKAGILEGRKATGWNDDNLLAGLYRSRNISHQPRPVVVDGNLVTGSGPAAAKEFGRRIVEVLLAR